jgi:hypothetical protein
LKIADFPRTGDGTEWTTPKTIQTMKQTSELSPQEVFVAEARWCPRQPYVCPVCNGNGLRPPGFYSQVSGIWTDSSTALEKCRSCDGTGVVWQPE